MATKAKNALISAFLKLLEREEFDKITVTSLVEECAISRQTFYYHFDDIETMLKWAFENETSQICKRLTNSRWSEASVGYVDFIKKFETLLKKASVSKNFIMVYNYMYQSFYTFIETYLTKKQGAKVLEKEETRFFISYTASAFCGLILLELQKEESDYQNLYDHITATFRQLEK